MTLKIRQVTLNDLAAVAAVEALCFPPAEAATRKSFEQRIQSFPSSFLVAELDGQIVGLIDGAVINETVIDDVLFADASLHIPGGAYQTIFGLDVLPEFRRQGIAALLIRHLISAAQSAGRRGVILTCKKALIPYYEKFGFVNKGLSKSVHGRAVWYDMILQFS